MEENQNRDEGKIERIKEEIHYRIEIIKLTAVFLLTAIGGEILLGVGLWLTPCMN